MGGFSGPKVVLPVLGATTLGLFNQHPVLLSIVVCGYLIMIGIAAVVGSLHSDEKRRADARKVLKRLLGYTRRDRPDPPRPPQRAVGSGS
jgi:hypothetical protein